MYNYTTGSGLYSIKQYFSNKTRGIKLETGKVIGNLWATKKDPRLNGQKLLIVKINDKTVIAADIIGAGVDDTVIVVSGTASRIAAGSNDIPVDLAVVGIVDSLPESEFIKS